LTSELPKFPVVFIDILAIHMTVKIIIC